MKHELKIEIRILRDDEVIWTDYASGDTDSIGSLFEQAEMQLGTMSRNLSMVLARDYKDEEYLACAKCGNPFLTEEEFNPKNGLCKGCENKTKPEIVGSEIDTDGETPESKDTLVS